MMDTFCPFKIQTAFRPIESLLTKDEVSAKSVNSSSSRSRMYGSLLAYRILEMPKICSFDHCEVCRETEETEKDTKRICPVLKLGAAKIMKMTSYPCNRHEQITTFRLISVL